MYFESHNKTECSGCTACMSACPKEAITMQPDEEGFSYPTINEETCIHCNICRKVCSWEHPIYNNADNPQVFAAVIKNKNERQKSTSGGVFYAIAEWIFRKGGVVFGAAFDETLQLHHVFATNMAELLPIRGSKYIQSDLGSVFKDVKKQLDSEKWCYFVGTGCQVAGLKAFLRKDYQTLVTSDLVCHGTPSQKVFNYHIKYLENKYKTKVINYKFRDYKIGEGCETCELANHKQIKHPSYELSPYLYSFMHAYTYRYSCYECKFARIPRQGDITLADYWGVKHFFPKIDYSNGCSMVLVNTERGKVIWTEVSKKCDYEMSNVADAAKFNGNLIHSSNKPEIRDIIYKEIEMKGYSKIASTTFRNPHHSRLKIIYFLLENKTIRKIYNLLKK